MATAAGKQREFWSMTSPYDRWAEAQRIPIHKGFYVEDLRSLELGWWEARGCQAAFLKLSGQEGISEARVTEIPPGGSLAPFRFALDEIVYVVEGRGVTAVWAEGKPKKTFEWAKHSMFLIPRNYLYQLSNMQGGQPVKLLHYNFLPIAMSAVPDPQFFFDNLHADPDILYGEDGDFYSEAKTLGRANGSDGSDLPEAQRRSMRDFWYGNFFPDLKNWDRLEAQTGRGGGSRVVHMRFPNSSMVSHMSVFPSRSYKKAHRHGPGVVIIIPAGEGYSVMWKEGQEKTVIPWHEASVFVPPNRWFHQHFNVGATPARYLALRTPQTLSGYSERVEDRQRDQIEYPDQDPWIREKFETELGKKGIKSLMPEEAYRNRDFEWQYKSQ